MPKQTAHKWGFKPGMRSGLYSWRSSAKAAAKLKAAITEIKTANKTDPIIAADGVVVLAERIWPAFEHIDTSSGALGTAVNRSLMELIPILIAAPAEETIRAKWLTRLRDAIESDGVNYLQPISDHFGEIAFYPSLQNEHADRDLDLIRRAWSDWESYAYVGTATLTLSCLLSAGRYDELLALLAVKKNRMWFDEKFGAKALLLQGQETEALAFAQSLLNSDRQPWGYYDIALFCEAILIGQGRDEEAYQQFGLPFTPGNTYLAIWRDLIRRYPDLDARRILEDLMGTHGSKGKWFAAAKTAHYFDIALDCAAHHDAAPATLIRAARDYKIKEPAFAAQVARYAIVHLLAGRGYEMNPSNMDEAVDYFMAASIRINQGEGALKELKRLALNMASDVHMVRRLRDQIAKLERGNE